MESKSEFNNLRSEQKVRIEFRFSDLIDGTNYLVNTGFFNYLKYQTGLDNHHIVQRFTDDNSSDDILIKFHCDFFFGRPELFWSSPMPPGSGRIILTPPQNSSRATNNQYTYFARYNKNGLQTVLLDFDGLSKYIKSKVHEMTDNVQTLPSSTSQAEKSTSILENEVQQQLPQGEQSPKQTESVISCVLDSLLGFFKGISNKTNDSSDKTPELKPAKKITEQKVRIEFRFSNNYDGSRMLINTGIFDSLKAKGFDDCRIVEKFTGDNENDCILIKFSCDFDYSRYSDEWREPMPDNSTRIIFSKGRSPGYCSEYTYIANYICPRNERSRSFGGTMSLCNSDVLLTHIISTIDKIKNNSHEMPSPDNPADLHAAKSGKN